MTFHQFIDLITTVKKIWRCDHNTRSSQCPFQATRSLPQCLLPQIHSASTLSWLSSCYMVHHVCTSQLKLNLYMFLCVLFPAFLLVCFSTELKTYENTWVTLYTYIFITNYHWISKINVCSGVFSFSCISFGSNGFLTLLVTYWDMLAFESYSSLLHFYWQMFYLIKWNIILAILTIIAYNSLYAKFSLVYFLENTFICKI